MNLIKLELINNYKKIKAGEVFKFNQKEILGILGENGSGKTILFELITDILSFSIMDREQQHKNLQEKNILFRLELRIKEKNVYIERLKENDLIRVYTKNCDGAIEEYQISNDLNIIIYSSAKRSILSNTYYKLLLSVLKNGTDIDNNFNSYIREKIKKIIIIYLFIFEEEYLKDIFQNIIEIKSIKKIELRISKNYLSKISFLKSLLEDEYESIEKNNHVNIILSKSNIEKIKDKYKKNGRMFYYLLQNLELLNIKELTKNENKINQKFVSEDIEDNYLSEEFSIQEIEFEDNITYRYLSEGELQLFETIGTIILFQGKEYNKDNLYIFDEPTTHLNVNWMAKYITLLKKALKIAPENRESKMESQIIFSTHNSDVMSDLPRAYLHLIKNGKFERITEETFGANELKLNRVYFNKIDTISDNVKNELALIMEEIDTENDLEKLKKIDKKIELRFANSPEKYNLLRSLDEKIMELGGE